MGTIVDVIVPTDRFALSDTFSAVPDATFETVCVVANEPGQVMPFVWGSSSDPERLDDALRNDSSTESVSRLAREGNRTLYQISWRAAVRVIVGVFVDSDGTLLRASGEDDRWELRVLFPAKESVSETYESWHDHGIDPSIRRVNGVDDVVSHGGMELSNEQHEALVAAFETDYYNVPRGVTQDGLAEQLGVSHQALSERLRRGHRNLIGSTLCEPPNPIKRRP